MQFVSKSRNFDLVLFPDNELLDEETQLMADMQPFPKHHVLSVMYSGHDTGKFFGTFHCTCRQLV